MAMKAQAAPQAQERMYVVEVFLSEEEVRRIRRSDFLGGQTEGEWMRNRIVAEIYDKTPRPLRFSTACSKDENARIADAGMASGKHVSVWARDVLLEAAAKEIRKRRQMGGPAVRRLPTKRPPRSGKRSA